MTPETLQLDGTEEKGPTSSRKSSEVISEDATSLREDTTLHLYQSRLTPWESGRRATLLHEADGEEQAGGVVHISFDEGAPGRRGRTPLGGSLDALRAFRSDQGDIDWLEIAIVLKRDAMRLRDTNYSRHAAVLLAVADAFTFTEPAEVAGGEGTRRLLDHALGLLSEPYISESSEEELLGELLMAGWNLTPSEEQAQEPVA